MLKRILVAILLLPGIAWGDNSFQANPDQTTIFAQGQFGAAAVDTKGNVYTQVIGPSGLSQSVIPVSNSAGLNGNLQSINGYFDVGTDTIEALSTTTVLVLTSHAARVGDIVMPTAGTAANVNVAIPVCSVATNSVTLCYPLPATPSTDAIIIRRPTPIFSPKEDAAFTDGDNGFVMFGVNNGAWSALVGGADYSIPYVNARGGGATTIVYDAALAGGTIGAVRLEDQVFAAGEPVVMSGGVNNRSGTAYNTTNGDATPFGVGDFGNSLSTLYFDATIFDGGVSPIGKEDRALNGSDALVMTGVRWLGTGAFGSPAGTANDAVYPDTDSENRLAVNAWGSQTGNFWQSCGTATAVTSDVAIIAADASNRTYLGSITCKNTSTTVGPTLDFKDGTTIIAVGAIAANSATGVLNSSFTMTFNPPLRGTSNTAFNFATNAATSSVTCCGSGFKSDQ